jgi:hypothetical protein
MRFLFTLLAALSVCSTITAFTPVTITSDPAASGTGSGQHKTIVEPHAFSLDGTMCAAYQVGRITDGGADRAGVSCSSDGGTTWTNTIIGGTVAVGGPWARVSDLWVAYSRKNSRWMVQGLLIDSAANPQGLGISYSYDHGATWSAFPASPIPITAGNFPDKNSFACDNTGGQYDGQCYMEWDFNSLGDEIHVATSKDGGLNWLAADSHNTGLSGLGGYVMVKPNGQVSIPFVTGCGTSGSSCIAHLRSLDGGATWVNPGSGLLTGNKPVKFLRASDLPAGTVDTAGNIHVTFGGDRCTGGKNEINHYSASGVDDSFGTPKCIPLPKTLSRKTVDYAVPSIAVSGSHIGIIAYEISGSCSTTSNCNMNLIYAKSSDNGATWTTDTTSPIWTMNQIASTTQGNMVGDYVGMVTSGANFVPFVPIGASGSGSTFNEPLTTVKGLSTATVKGLSTSKAKTSNVHGLSSTVNGVKSINFPLTDCKVTLCEFASRDDDGTPADPTPADPKVQEDTSTGSGCHCKCENHCHFH